MQVGRLCVVDLPCHNLWGSLLRAKNDFFIDHHHLVSVVRVEQTMFTSLPISLSQFSSQSPIVVLAQSLVEGCLLAGGLNAPPPHTRLQEGIHNHGMSTSHPYALATRARSLASDSKPSPSFFHFFGRETVQRKSFFPKRRVWKCFFKTSGNYTPTCVL